MRVYREHSFRLEIVGVVFFGLLGVPLIGGCAPSEIKWTEEVKLHDGKIIQLKRRTETTASGFPVQHRGFFTYHEFCYAPMKIYWKSKPDYPPELFDIVDGKAYAKVSLGRDCVRCMLHGYPETDALYFMWDGAAWKKISYEVFPKQLRLNLLQESRGADSRGDAHGLVTVQEKEKRDASIYYSLRVTGAAGLNELPDTKGACRDCRGINIKTDSTPEVFLPSDRKTCD